MQSTAADGAQSYSPGPGPMSRAAQLRGRKLVVAGGGLALALTTGLLILFLVVLDGSNSASGNQLEVPVTRGDLVEGISADGSIVLPERMALSFGSVGTLEELNVAVGDRVNEGDVLARLDLLTIAELGTAVEQAKTLLADVTDRLDDARSPANALDIATADAAVIEAEASVADAEDLLATLLEPAADDLLAATSAATLAEVKVEDAREALTELQALPDPEIVEDARVAVDLAREAYGNAQGDLEAEQRTWETALADAREAATTTRSDYGYAFRTWLGYELSDDDLARPPSAILSTAGMDLDELFDPSPGALALASGAPTDDPSTPWDELVLFTWNTLSFQHVVGTCSDSGPPPNTTCAQTELESAWDAATLASDSLVDSEARAANALTSSRKSVDSTDSALDAAMDALEEAREPATELDIRMAVETVLLAESDLRTATDALAETRSPDAGTVAAGRAGLEVARARLADAIAGLDDLRSVGTDQQLIALREAETEAAAAALADTQAVFVAATIRAPAAGVIDAVHVEVGNELGRNETVIELLDPSIVTVVMDVDQVDILSVFVGAQTSVTVDALPGQTLPGLISEIGPASLAQGGAVSFPVTVQVNLPAGIELLEGLSATAQVLSDVVRNVLMVPAVAVGGTFTSPTVNVLNGGSVETVQISLGGGNETFAIIASGVVEGDIVVFTLPDTNQQTNPFAVFREGFGGGRGFGGGGGGGGFGGGGGGGGGARGFDDHN